MRATEYELMAKKFTKFTNSYAVATNQDELSLEDSFGGIIQNAKFGWIARKSHFEIFAMKDGQKIGNFRFDNNLGFEKSIITSICEIETNTLNSNLLAICIQFGDATGSIIAVYSIQGSKILRCIEIAEKVTSCHFIGRDITKRTILQIMQGCVAVGTDLGKVLLLDLNFSECEKRLLEPNANNDDIILVPCHIVQSSLDFSHIQEHYKHSIQENINFGIELEYADNPSFVLSILSISPALSLAVGLEDGRMILYDLSELQVFFMAKAPDNISPLVKLAYLEPPDDPRANLYIFAFHENYESSIAIMHSVMYDKKIIEDDNFILFEEFQGCHVRLKLPIHEQNCLPITCQSITKLPVQGDEDIISLCLLAWKNDTTTQILVFDLNQWYKEEMPGMGDWRKNLSYLSPFSLKHCNAFDIFIDLNTIALFNSIQRVEEHFYPISLTFDCVILLPKGSSYVHWTGLQNRALDILNAGGALAILEPGPYFNEILKSSLMPQFYDYNYNATFSLKAQREILLSVALEYNCFGLLKDCARSWADGSYLGRKPYEGLSLSTLTDWVWLRAGQIKNRCNTLCVPLFDHSGVRIDERVKKELFYLSRQLKLLADLLQIIIVKCKLHIPKDVHESLKSQHSSMRMASEYQEVLQWLLNIGLLPEGTPNLTEENDRNQSFTHPPFIPYPYKILNNYYMSQRMRFYNLNKGLLRARTQSCRMLYIDCFIEHECNVNVLREHWLESGGNGLYPPSSMQAMLRTLLVPDIPLETKYALFIYLFLDLNMAVETESHAEIVNNLIKFPAVFKMNAPLIKSVQAFWNLDHGQFEIALEDVISPFLQDKKLAQWEQEILIESLLIQDQPNLALRALQARSSPVNSVLELKTLMSNDLIAEAFHLARSKSDLELIKTFFNGCIYLGKYSVLRDLSLTEEEGKIVEEILKQSKSSKAENLHFVYLLQKSKYVEAISYLDELSSNNNNRMQQKSVVDLETPTLLLSAYNLTMTPSSKSLAESYYKIRDKMNSSKEQIERKFNENSPSPFSCQLLRHNDSLLSGGIFQSSTLSIDNATNYWDETANKNRFERLKDTNNVPFIRKPQLDAYVDVMPCKDLFSYPEIFKDCQKRRLNDDSFNSANSATEKDLLENPQKRRRIGQQNESLLITTSLKNRSTKIVNTSLLTKFADKKKTNKLHDGSQSTFVASSRNRSNSGDNLLNTPIVKSCRAGIKDDSQDGDRDNILTPHSILKVKHLIRSETPLRSRDFNSSQMNIDNQNNDESELDYSKKPDMNVRSHSDTEEKSIRFEMPRLEEPLVKAIETTISMERNITTKSSELSTLSPNLYPKSRRPLRSADSSFQSTDEFYSPFSSKTNTPNVSKNESSIKYDSYRSDSDTTKELSDNTSIITPIRKSEKEISKDSGAIVCMSSDLSTSVSDHIGTRLRPDGPKPRRPLSRSQTPPDTIQIDNSPIPKSASKSTRSSKSPPDLMLSPSRRSTRLSVRLEREKTPEHSLIGSPSFTSTTPQRQSVQKSLSRIVLETNALKNVKTKLPGITEKIIAKQIDESIKMIRTDDDDDDDEFTETSDKKFAEPTEKESVSNLLRADTASFKPMISSSKVCHSTSKFISRENESEANVNVISEHTTVDGEISFSDSTINPVISKEIYLEEDKKQQQNRNFTTLMTTVSNNTCDWTMIDSNTKTSQEISFMDVDKSNVDEFGLNANETYRNITELNENVNKPDLNIDKSNKNVSKANINVDESNLNVDKPKQYKDIPIISIDAPKESNDEDDIQMDVSENMENVEDTASKNMDKSKSGSSTEIEKFVVEIKKGEVVNVTEAKKSSEVVEFDSSTSSSNSKSDVGDKNNEVEEENEEEEEDIELDENHDNNSISDGRNYESSSSSKSSYSDNDIFNFPDSNPANDQDDVINISSSSESTDGSNSSENLNSQRRKTDDEEKLIPQSSKEISELLYGDIDEEDNYDDPTECHDSNSLSDLLLFKQHEPIINPPINESIEDNITDSSSLNVDTVLPIESNSTMNFLTGEDDMQDLQANNDAKIKTSKDKLKSNKDNKIEKIQNKSEKITKEETKQSNVKESVDDITEIIEPSKNIESNIALDSTVEFTEDDSINLSQSASLNKSKPSSDSVKNSDKEVIKKIEEEVKTVDRKKSPQPSTSKDSLLSLEDNTSDLATDVLQLSQESGKSTLTTLKSNEEIILKFSDDENTQEGVQKKIQTPENKIILNKKEKSITPENKNLLNIEAINTHYLRSNTNRKLRAQSVEVSSPKIIEIKTEIINSPTRFTRATSVPKTDITPRSLRAIKAESLDNLTPARILTRRQSQALERIEENNLLNTPTRITRSRKRLDSNDSEDSIINTNQSESSNMTSKRSRRTSVNSENSETIKTPRSVRASSILTEDNIQTPKRASKRLSMTKDATPIKQKIIEEPVVVKKKEKESTNDKLTDERRLTRTQKTMLEKTAIKTAAVNQKNIPIKKRPTKKEVEIDSEDSPKKTEASPKKAASESGSIKSISSRKSNKSSTKSLRISTRSLKAKDDDEQDDEVASIASSYKSSSSKRKGKTAKDKKEILKVIPEDNDVESTSHKGVSDAESNSSENPQPAKKVRPRKQKK